MTKFGQNLGYIDDLYRRYLAEPASLSEAWQEFFKDYRPEERGAEPASPAAAAPRATPPPGSVEPTAEAAPAAVDPSTAVPLRGITAKIAENMSLSIAVPTATSTRTIPVKLLEENRRIINHHQATVSGPKISFTHVIAYALTRALLRHPRMNVAFGEIDGKPQRLERSRINLGLAIDVERKGERILLVPNIKDAGSLGFPAFVAAYDNLVDRSRDNKLDVPDFENTTCTLTNPGMLGTNLSVPRLMQGQGAIFGVGSIAYPAEYAGMAAEMVSELGLSKVMNVTSTYDHRVIQGALSGEFLATLDKILEGGTGFYTEIFQQLGVPREPMVWSGDQNPQILGGTSGSSEAIAKQAGVLQLIRAYRVRGHLWADLNPLAYEPVPHAELELSTYGLTVWDLDRRFIAGGLGGARDTMKLRDILDTLQNTYCRHIGVEYMHIPEPATRHWLELRLESPGASDSPPRDEQIRILRMLNTAEAFETFLHTSYVGQKRFSLEGAETALPMLEALLEDATEAGIEEVVIGMAHRGRLNVLAHIVGKSYGQIFGEFEGINPDTSHGSGDVKYHVGARGTFTSTSRKELKVSMSSNPSHLEAVNPVVEGMVRARQDRLGDAEHGRVMPVLIHGDAAFSGQGVVAETLNLSLLRGYRTGGTVHLVINNQIGFTTRPEDLRSSQYSTDVAKMLRSPIFHVNGDHPEEAVRVMRLALAFRKQFGRDVVVDLVCYRRWGHNEADDPSYTNPIMYAHIKAHRSVRKLYTEQLVRRGDFDLELAEEALKHYRDRLQEVHSEVREALEQPTRPPSKSVDELENVKPSREPQLASLAVLQRVMEGLSRTPSDFEVHPKLARQMEQRAERFNEDRIDWATAEALAFGSLVLAGHPVRLSGEDSGRGTFSQRHAILYDHRTAAPYVPLAHLAPEQARFTVFDSLLSEFAVLGFDYGYSVNYPEALVMWEAQFGDFNNGAQVIIDQFIVSAEEKWNQKSSIVLLLPHGYEGQGPEHSSARLERFLQLAARGNIQVAYPSTPAQYFHVLRGQVSGSERKPLIVMTPKSLLRLPACVSTRETFTSHGFELVLDDPRVPDPQTAQRLILCSGKLYYDLDEARLKDGAGGVAVCRLEQLYPYPAQRIEEALARFAHVRDIVWAQEEPSNMGAWTYIQDRLRESLRRGQGLRYVGRRRAASPAAGSHKVHLTEQEAIVREALTGSTPSTATKSGAATTRSR